MAKIVFRENRTTPGEGRWYIDLGDKHPGPKGSRWVPCTTTGDKNGPPLFSRRADREKVSKWRDDYVAAMQRVNAGDMRGAEESATKWHGRYYDAAEAGSVGRKNRGQPQAAVADRRTRFATHIEPEIGDLPMVSVTSNDLRRVVARLNAGIRERYAYYARIAEGEEPSGRKPGISPKTAAHVWSEGTSAFREACASNDPSLRVRDDDPSRGVLPPNGGETREQEALYPSEVVQLLSCEGIPRPRRIVYAVCIYGGLRRSEAERLQAEDVDLEHGTIKVRRSGGRRGKSDAAFRTVPIEGSLAPLMAVLLAETPSGALLDVPVAHGRNGAADLMKKDLVRAGLVRADLTRDDAQHMPFTFHGLRHTAITHWVVSGKSELFLLTAAGHSDLTMTKRYLAKGAAVSAKFGQPHPPVPASLVGKTPIPGDQAPVTEAVTEDRARPRRGWKKRSPVVGPPGLERTRGGATNDGASTTIARQCGRSLHRPSSGQADRFGRERTVKT